MGNEDEYVADVLRYRCIFSCRNYYKWLAILHLKRIVLGNMLFSGESFTNIWFEKDIILNSNTLHINNSSIRYVLLIVILLSLIPWPRCIYRRFFNLRMLSKYVKSKGIYKKYGRSTKRSDLDNCKENQVYAIARAHLGYFILRTG